MRAWWSLRLFRFGPLSMGVGGSKRVRARRQPVFHGHMSERLAPPHGWTCPHDHRRQDTADDCANRELRRRNGMLMS